MAVKQHALHMFDGGRQKNKDKLKENDILELYQTKGKQKYSTIKSNKVMTGRQVSSAVL